MKRIKHPLNQYKLKTIIQESIDKLLMEELGISDEVHKEADKVYRILNNDARQLSHTIEWENGVGVVENKLTIPIFNVECKARYRKYEFDSHEAMIKFLYNHMKDLTCYHRDNTFTFNYIDDRWDSRSGSYSIEHELLHAYNSFKSNYSNLLGKAQKLYPIAIDNFNNPCAETQYLSRLIYLSVPTEQNALVQEMYRFIMGEIKDHSNPNTVKDVTLTIAKQSNAYKLYNLLKTVEDYLNNRDFIEETSKAIFQRKDIEWWRHLCNTTLKSFQKKLFKCLHKCNTDIYKQMRDNLPLKDDIGFQTY